MSVVVAIGGEDPRAGGEEDRLRLQRLQEEEVGDLLLSEGTASGGNLSVLSHGVLQRT